MYTKQEIIIYNKKLYLFFMKQYSKIITGFMFMFEKLLNPEISK